MLTRNPQVSNSSRTDEVRAVLVGVDSGQSEFSQSMAELQLLASAAGSIPVETVVAKRLKPDPTFFVGSGKVEQIAELIQEKDADIVIFNHSLSPAQQRNLERGLKRHVLDRTGLILDIFAQRAKSHVGKVQVELANVKYRLSRLVKAWSHLERQKGGIGMRGGPGETQMELDRRMLETKGKRLQAELSKLQRQQSTQRRARMKRDVFSISLVGYTNAGKSTLFNALTKAGTYAADQLFATLDTTSRRMYLPEYGNVVISDTVGFIQDLPHQLVEAFRATLDETVHADLLLHVVDAASPVRDQQIREVEKVLEEIGAQHIPVILVMNKIDSLPEYLGRGAETRLNKAGEVEAIYLSAKSGVGIDLLREVLANRAKIADKIKQKDLPPEESSPSAQVERPPTADYEGGLSSSTPSYSPRDV